MSSNLIPDVNVLLQMKRKNTKKSDSFDYIRISPKRASSHANSISLRDPHNNSPTIQQKSHKDRHYVELPKIHPIKPLKIKQDSDKYEAEYLQLQSKLLLLGYQYRRQFEHFQPRQFREDKRQQSRKRISIICKQNYISKRAFISDILSQFGVSEILLEKRKLFVYVEQGNNSRMIKQLIRKRSHVVFVNQKKQANLIWTRFCDFESSKLTSKFRQQKIRRQYSQQICYDNQEYLERNKSSRKLGEYSEIIGSLEREKSLQTKPSQQQNITIIIEDFKYHNHFTNHFEISDKKSLLSNLQKYCIKNKINLFDIVPLTFQISTQQFQLPSQITNEGYWFVKPGEDTNRGNGISIARGRDQVKQKILGLFSIGKTALVQQYIDPFLYKNRKFDIRCYCLVICFRGQLKAYWYKEGYIRTCSKQFNYDITDLFAHLTNDAVQKKSSQYGKYQQSNKLSFHDIENYFKTKQVCFMSLTQQMKVLAVHSIKSVEQKLKNQKNQFNFEVFGYDFLIDKKGKIWLIEINTNPCLQFTGSLTSRVISHMIDNSLKIALDPFLGETGIHGWRDQFQKIIDDNKYQVII